MHARDKKHCAYEEGGYSADLSLDQGEAQEPGNMASAMAMRDASPAPSTGL